MRDRDKALSIMKHWVDMPSPAHPEIVLGYNNRKPLPRGYELKLGDAWCAATVSEALSQVCPENPYREVSAQKLYELMKAAFGSEFDTTYIKPGDLVFYDWDNNGNKDHVGMVYAFNEKGEVAVIEGNVKGKMHIRVFRAGDVVNGCKLPEYIPFVYPDELPSDPAKRWYSDTMEWAKANGLITEERPNDPITRAEMLTILKRFYDTMI